MLHYTIFYAKYFCSNKRFNNHFQCLKGPKKMSHFFPESAERYDFILTLL